MNAAILVGYVVNEIYSNGDKMVRFKMGTKSGYNRKEKKDIISYVPVTVFGLSEEQKNVIKKGTRLAIRGNVAERSYEKDGQRVYVTQVTADRKDVTFV